MGKKFLFSILCLLLISNTGLAKEKDDQLYQVSTINALLAGLYDCNFTFGELKKYGDIGLGTFNNIDGEMIQLDGTFYQVKSDGKVYNVPDNEKTPFAAVTFFDNDKSIEVKSSLNYRELTDFLDQNLPTDNIFYAFKIPGTFKYIKTRSVPAQKKPFPPLVEVVKEQSYFEFKDIKGTIVGFRCPAYASGVNVAGYHLHFLSADKKAGGHLLECETDTAQAQVDYIRDFRLLLPETSEFYSIDLSEEKKEEVHAVEKSPPGH
jgi:acetolactate decarboxylase